MRIAASLRAMALESASSRAQSEAISRVGAAKLVTMGRKTVLIGMSPKLTTSTSSGTLEAKCGERLHDTSDHRVVHHEHRGGMVRALE